MDNPLNPPPPLSELSTKTEFFLVDSQLRPLAPPPPWLIGQKNPFFVLK